MIANMQQNRGGATLVDLIDRILDKGLVINADISVSLVGVELLDIKLRAAIASFETAAHYGLEMPSGTNMERHPWIQAEAEREQCPDCNRWGATDTLLNEGCAWCGWTSPRKKIGNALPLQPIQPKPKS